jgi:hypothetical protein
MAAPVSLVEQCEKEPQRTPAGAAGYDFNLNWFV